MATWVGRILRGLGFLLGLLYFATEDLARFLVAPVLAALAKLGLWQRAERLIAALPPYGALCVLAVPMLVLEPVKLAALWWIASGRLLAGAAVLAAAKIAGMAVILRLHAIAEPKLLSIPWYRSIHDRVLSWRRRIYLAVMVRGGLRHALQRAKVALRGFRVRAIELRARLERFVR
ncbi:MAG: hypothetical protein ING44_11570 [Telmatospirillum sp.]|nr:hypothetical protein [Telmatospirillum sp.]